MDIKFTYTDFGVPNAVTDRKLGLVASYLASDLQTVEMCDNQLRWYRQYVEDPENNPKITIGNVTRREIVGDNIHLFFNVPAFADDPTYFGEPIVIPIKEMTELIIRWREHLQKPRPSDHL